MRKGLRAEADLSGASVGRELGEEGVPCAESARQEELQAATEGSAGLWSY